MVVVDEERRSTYRRGGRWRHPPPVLTESLTRYFFDLVNLSQQYILNPYCIYLHVYHCLHHMI